MHGSEIDLSGNEMSLRPSKHVWAYDWLALVGLAASSNGEFNLPLTAHPPPPPTSPTTHLTCPPIHATRDITVVVKKLHKIQQC